MRERRLDRFGTPSQVTQRVKEDLTIDASQNGMLMLTLAGTNAAESAAFLDVLASTAAAESSRQVDLLSDHTPAVVAGERREGGLVRYATVNPVPIRDDRFEYALPIFAVMFGGSLVLIVVTYMKLARAKRIFDQENAMLFADVKVSDF